MSELSRGMEVLARGKKWEIVDVVTPLDGQIVYRLRGLENPFNNIEFDIMSPLETITPLEHKINPEKAAPIQYWLIYHQAYLLEQTMGADTILNSKPGRLVLEPYQLVPLVRALKMNRPRLLLCDDVGLGKTIQAALIMTELISRKLAHRILIVSPAGPLLRQWQAELLEKFGLRVDVIDREKIEEIKKKSELGANPLDFVPYGLISIDFLKQERIMELLDKTSYDIVIIDEAHHCSESGVAGDEEDTKDNSLRRRLAALLSEKSDMFFLLTATPHNGNNRSFASLLELLDSSLVDGRGSIRGEKYRPFVVRRLKRHIKDHITGAPKFKERQTIPCPVIAKKGEYDDFIVFHKALLEMIAPELKSAFRNRRYDDVLSYIALLKRSVSTAYACLNTLTVIRDRFNVFVNETQEEQHRKKERIKTLKDYSKKIDKFGIISYEEEQDQQFLVAEDIAEQLAYAERVKNKDERTLKRKSATLEKLNDLIALAEETLDMDPKIDVVIKTIEDVRSKEPKTNVIIYTEYIDSQDKLVKTAKEKGFKNVLCISGDLSEEERMKIAERFCSEDDIILVSTDAAAEGLNLQKMCHNLIHLELPFNPNRLEQRNGRIDRYGQTQDPIIRYLYLVSTFEERILLRLIAKYERQKKHLTFVPDTLGITCSTENSCGRLLKGIMDEDEKLFKDETPKIDFYKPEEDSLGGPAEKELFEDIDRSLKSFDKAVKENIWLGEAGVNAEAELVSQADKANSEGLKLVNVDLSEFVMNAVRLDGETAQRKDKIIELKLPSSWVGENLKGIPGYSFEDRTIRLTESLDLTKDTAGNNVGYLGSSHPILHKAIDRVKNVNFANQGQLDRRVTAIRGDDSQYHILFTFLGSATVKSGKMLEKIICMRLNKNGDLKQYLSPAEWLKYTDEKNAVNTKEVWKKHYDSWGNGLEERALVAAKKSFEPIAEKYVSEWKKAVESEEARVDEWFKLRVTEITGAETGEVQTDIFETELEEAAAWIKMSDPLSRLSAFAVDKHIYRAKKSEAVTLLNVYKKRKKTFEDSLKVKNIGVKTLGMIMILPKEYK